VQSLKPIGPLFKWYGSKHTSSKHYPAPIPGLPVFEPYAGSAGYSQRYHDQKIVLWEINPRLQELWCWLIYKASPDDIRNIPLNIPEGTDIRTMGLDWGQQLLLKNWQRTNNLSECWTISSWGNSSGQWTQFSRDRLADQIGAIKHWEFRQPQWTEQGTWHLDPPYRYNYQYGVKDFDYNKLVDNINQIPQGSLIIACEAVGKGGEVPNYLPFQPSHSQVTSRRKASNNHHSKELVYVHYT
jgi:site-specific DNA-adenine methylase